MTVTLNCIIENYDTREEWLTARMKGIGASDTAGILGEGYEDQSAVTVWDSKRNAPREIPPEKLKRFQVAKRLEPAMRGIFADETGWPCESPGEFTIHRNTDLPWLFATLDGLTEHPDYGLCAVELKDVGVHNRKDWEGEPPLKFQVQCQHQMAASGLGHAFLLGLVGRVPVIKHVPRNERFIAAMLAKLEEFWGYVERGEVPPIDTSVATGKILAKLWPEDSGATVVLPPEAIEWAAEKQFAEAVTKEMKAIETAAENKIKAAIGPNAFGDLPPCATAGGIQEAVTERLLEAVNNIVLPPLPLGFSWKTQPCGGYTVERSTTRVLRSRK